MTLFSGNGSMAEQLTSPPVDRQSMDVDIACVGFGPAMGGFLTTLVRELQTMDENGSPALQSQAMPGMPPQVICYERADDIAFGVSGVVTRARGIRASFPDLDSAQIPMCVPVKDEKVLYLLDPHGASRRSLALRIGDRMLRGLGMAKLDAYELPYSPEFLHKKDGLVMSIGQFNQWVGAQLLASGAVQIWPATPVAEPLFATGDLSATRRVAGVRLVDQGVDRQGRPDTGFMPGMDIHAALTVVGDGPVGPVGRQIDEHLGTPRGHERHEWAVGMKFVIDLRPGSGLEPGTVFHSFGYPEPEIFGFLYVHPENVATVGIFVPSWFDSPARTAYRYLQHYIQHPYFWRYLEGGTLRSWGAKSLQESGKRGEPWLAGDGYARIGEGSGSTNVLTGSGVDEAWTTGTLLAEAVLELMRAGKPFTKENLECTYVARRRTSWVEKEAQVAQHARDGFQKGVVTGLVGMALAGLTGGRLSSPGTPAPTHARMRDASHYGGRISPDEMEALRANCKTGNVSFHDALLDRLGWPQIPFDGKLLVSHQDALLMGGKVQAAAGYADHVVFLYPSLCEECGHKLCIEICSGQAITSSEGGVPDFDREKCVHCGACIWNCTREAKDGSGRTNIEFRAGAGGLHSSEN
jgi:electron-transferring-flavoprotein dehydrogenase